MTLPSRPARLTKRDLVCNFPIGLQAGGLASSRSPALSPREALESSLTEALQRPPCLVSFSGGRDSSSLLCLATHVARRESLPLPIPATLQFPDMPSADESDWQLNVITHLGLSDWHRHVVGAGEFDAVGPVASDVLRRHGLLWPFNTYFHVPLLARAAGGSIVTGVGGDEIGQASQGSRAAQLLSLRRAPVPIDALVLGLALSPRWVRVLVARGRQSGLLRHMPWLTPAGADVALAVFSNLAASHGVGMPAYLQKELAPSRYRSVIFDSLTAVAEGYSVVVRHPFLDQRMLDALSARPYFAGLGTRAELISRLFGDVLPPGLAERRTKGEFTPAAWTQTATDFAAGWSGEGLPSDFIDTAELRAHWSGKRPNMMSAILLQAAWLYDSEGQRAYLDDP